MLTIKQKVGYLEKRGKELLDKQKKSLPFSQAMIINASFTGLSNLLKTTRSEKLENYLKMAHSYIGVLLSDHNSIEELEAKLDEITSNGH